jgi:hypothetical protein
MHESVADRLIREAIERGEFDDLPGSGNPIPGAGRPHDPNWWVRSFLDRERSDDRRRAEYQRIEARVGSLWSLTSESAVRQAVARLNAEIEHLDRGDGRTQPFDTEAVVRSWKSMVRARSRRSTGR